MKVMKNELNLNVEHFIEAVRSHPQLWDPSHDDYKVKCKRRAAWLSVSECIGDFSDKGTEEKNEIAKILMSKWRGLKDNYAKNLRRKSLSGKSGGRQYLYAKQLSFLDLSSDSSRTRKRSKNSHRSEQPCGESDDDTESVSSEMRVPVDGVEPVVELIEPENESDDTIDDFNPTNVIINADKAFFESLLPMVSKFSDDQKLEFRSEVIKLVKLIKRRTAFEIVPSTFCPTCQSTMKT